MMNTKAYWLIRKFCLSLKFHIKKIVFRIFQFSQHASLFQYAIIKTIFIQILSGVSVTYVLMKIDGYILDKINGTAFITDMFKDIVLGGMSIAGVILGLYCANLMSIFSAQYTNAPRSIADAFHRDSVSNRCINQIISYIVICVLFLLGCISGTKYFWGSVVVLLLLTINMVVTFSITGNRSYFLSDSFRIAHAHHERMQKTLKTLSKASFFANDSSFQAHFRKVCKNAISGLEDIVEYNQAIPKAQNQALRAFMNNNIVILNLYWSIKPGVYFDSSWYNKKTQYKQWHRASFTEVEIAMKRTLPSITNEVNDKWWFEDAILKVNQIGVEKMLKDEDTIALYQYILNLHELSKRAYDADALEYWLRHLKSIQDKITNYIQGMKQEEKNAHEEALSGLVEGICSVYLCVYQGVCKSLLSFNADAFYQRAKECNKYDHNMLKAAPYMNCPECENLFRQIQAEYTLENRRVTPDWYIEQIIAYQLYKKQSSIVSALSECSSMLLELGEAFLLEKQNYISSVTFSYYFRIRELYERILFSLKSILPALEEKQFEKSIVWEKVDLSELECHQKKLDMIVLPYLVDCCSAFAVKHWANREEAPDFLGFCYYLICESLLNAIESDDFDSFQKIYKGFFKVVLIYHEYVRSDVAKIKEEHLQMTVISKVVAPFAKYAVLSGLAIIWGEFREATCWKDLVCDSISNYLCDNPKKNIEILEHFTTLMKQKPLLGVGGRDTLTTSWEIRIEHAISTHPSFHVVYPDPFRRVLETNSKLLKAFIHDVDHDRIHLTNTEDVFFVVGINPHLDEANKYRSRFGWEDRWHEGNDE